MLARSSHRAACVHNITACSATLSARRESTAAAARPAEHNLRSNAQERPRRQFNPHREDGGNGGQDRRPRAPRSEDGFRQQGSNRNRPQESQDRSAIAWLSVDEFGGSSSLTARLMRAKDGGDRDQLLKMFDGEASGGTSGAPKIDLASYLGGGVKKDRTGSHRQQRSNSAAQSQSPRAPAGPSVQETAPAKAEAEVAERNTSVPEAEGAKGSMEIEMTDLDKLFGTAPAASKQQLSAKSKVISAHSSAPTTRAGTPMSDAMSQRVQRILEVEGGDYSRYLPAIQGLNQPERRTPLGIAQLAMARRREAGLRQRRNALGVLQKQIVSEVQERPAA